MAVEFYTTFQWELEAHEPSHLLPIAQTCIPVISKLAINGEV